ncbi:MAG: hypothetical protein WA091_02315 [Minisyncoccales bacterium]
METKTYDKQTAKFIAILVENMPKISADTMQGWIENPVELKKILTEVFFPSQKFEIWKIIRIGVFHNVYAIRNAIEQAGMKIGNYANDILGKIDLAPSETNINLVVLSVADLGLKDGTKYEEICERAKEIGLELCPAEVGPCLRSQYKNQPNGEVIIAMEPVADSDGDLKLFGVVREGNDDCWLYSYYAYSDRFWNSDCRFVFVLPQVK